MNPSPQDAPSLDMLIRNPANAEKKPYDAIIIGGGVYGVMMAMESSLRGIATLLLEQADFGQFTSTNSLRIIHGGFRYLQNLDLPRLLESSRERTFFLKTFPGLVHPIDCVMPLYGEGFRRPSLLLAATLLYEMFTLGKNQGIRPESAIHKGRILGIQETKRLVPGVHPKGLKGAVAWQDGFAPDSQRVLMESLRQAVRHGAVCLNYMKAEDILAKDGQVKGILAEDMESGGHHAFRAPCVINAAGPWCRLLAARFHRDIPRLFHSTLAWNVLFNRPAPTKFALAAAPRNPHSRTYFLVPYKGRLFAGTGHAPWPYAKRTPMPSTHQLTSFIEDLNAAHPPLCLRLKDVACIFPGLQPTDRPGSAELSHREIMIDHGNEGGPKGLYSISGVKFTTARRVAGKLLRHIFPKKIQRTETAAGNEHSMSSRHLQSIAAPANDAASFTEPDESHWLGALVRIAREEAVIHLDDLIVRRSSLWENPEYALKCSPHLCRMLGYDETRTRMEIKRLKAHFRQVVAAAIV